MKKLLILALALGLLSSFGHFYLAKRAYQLEAGKTTTSSICNIGENINCDSALLSPYAKIFGISLSNFGLGFNLVLSFLLLIFLIFGANVYWKNTSVYLTGVIAFSSIGMAIISVTQHLFCPICWALYFLSFVMFAILFFCFKKELFKPLNFLKKSIKQNNSYFLAGTILLISLFFHINFMTIFDIKDQKEILSALLKDWQYENPKEIEPVFLLQKGTPGSKIVIVEFADFLCPSCKKVQPALKTFLTHFPDVDFKFYVYPLDGSCNPSLNFNRSGLSCELSKTIICGEKQNKGWLLHDFIFQNQNQFLEVQGNKEKTKILFKKMLSEINIEPKNFEKCMRDPAVLKMVKKSATAGDKIHIQGTPSFFINGKQIRHHSFKLLILKEAYDYLKN